MTKSETRIKSDVELLSKLLLSGRFRVPWHQRHYDWKDREVAEFLRDLREALDTEKVCYFLGSIMLLGTEDPRGINDGQQRLITFSLLLAALCHSFADECPGTSRESLALRILFNQPEVTTPHMGDAPEYEVRIDPPEDDKGRYRHLLRGRDIGSNGRLTSAWDQISDFIGTMDQLEREAFFDFLTTRVEVSVLTVPPEVDANLVFESLNARGRPLDPVALIRNWLFSYFPADGDGARLDTVRADFEKARVILGSTTNVPEEYLRCFLQCQYGFIPQKEFYRGFREKFQDAVRGLDAAAYTYDLVGRLGHRDSIEIFRAIRSANPSESLASRLPKISGKRDLHVLLRELKGFTVSHPLCFALIHRFINEADAAKKRATKKLVTRSMKNLASFIMRSSFVNYTFKPYALSKALANCARDVFTAADLASLDVMDCLTEHDAYEIIADQNFVRRMSTMEMRTSRALQYLFGINAHQQRGSGLQQNQCTVEHVLPESSMHWQGWGDFSSAGEHPADWVRRNGNLVLLDRRENQGDADFNANFEAKKRWFANSTIEMARHVAKKYPNWTPQVVEARSHRLAKRAARIWSFSRGK